MDSTKSQTDQESVLSFDSKNEWTGLPLHHAAVFSTKEEFSRPLPANSCEISGKIDHKGDSADSTTDVHDLLSILLIPDFHHFSKGNSLLRD
jgi:hypothetical protein